jgi:phosphoribulokinase
MPDKQMAIQRAVKKNDANRPIMIAIAGDSAAGKTTLTKGLVAALGPDRISSMCVDDYHRYDRNERKELPFTPLHPDCNYLDIMEQHLQLLSMGQPILKPVYNHSNGMLERPVLVEPSEFMVIEGLFPLWSKVSRACFDATVYLDPPEPIRRAWKVARDTSKRGYTEEQVLADLDKREPESEAYIRPQRSSADIVVQFSPILSRGETAEDPLSATLLLRPTIPHPDLLPVVGDETSEAMHLKLLRDDDGKPVDALHVHSYASEEATRKVEEAIWDLMAVPEPLSEDLGLIDGERDGPLAITQLILLYHLIQAPHH